LTKASALNSDSQANGLHEKLVGSVFVALVVALPLLSYPLAMLPKGWAAERFALRIPWTELAAAILIVVLVRQPGRPLRLSHHAQPLLFGLLALLFAQTLSALLDAVPGGRLPWMLRAIGWLLLTLTAAHFLPARHLASIAMAWTLASAAEAAIIILQFAGNTEPVGTIGNRNFAAGYLALSLPLGLAWLSGRAKRLPALSADWLVKWMLAGNYVALMAAAVLLTQSRAATVVLVAAAAVWGLGRLRARARWLAALCLIAAALAAAFCPAIQRKAKTLWQTDVRPAIWQGTFHLIAEAPVLGHGPGSFAREYPAHRPAEYFDRPKAAVVTDHAHNELLEVAAEHGLAGLAAFLVVLGLGAHAAWRVCRNANDPNLRRLGCGMAFGLAALLCHNLVDVNLRHPPNQTLLWIGLGWLAAALAAGGGKAAESMHELRRFTCLAAWAVALFILILGVCRPLACDWFLRQGLLAQARGNLSHALDAFSWAGRMDTDRIEAWRHLGLVANATGQRPLAIAAFGIAYELAPNYGNLSGELASLLAMNGNYAEAAVLFQRATRLYPKDASNFAKLAKVLLALKQREQARAALATAQRLEPASPLVRAVADEFKEPDRR
jgi:O-antigen ligase